MNMRALRGYRSDTDQAFETEDGLLGGAMETEDAAAQGQADPELNYRPWWKVQADEMHEVVHRFAEAQHQARSQQNTGKGKLFTAFLKDHGSSYAAVARNHGVMPRSSTLCVHSAEELQRATATQNAIAESRKDELSKPLPRARSVQHSPAKTPRTRTLQPEELPLSPIDCATGLVAISGVWRHTEQ